MTSTVRLSDPAHPPRPVRPLVSRDCDRIVIWLEGEQDIATMPLLADTMAKAIAVGDADLLVDLSGVTFTAATSVDPGTAAQPGGAAPFSRSSQLSRLLPFVRLHE